LNTPKPFPRLNLNQSFSRLFFLATAATYLYNLGN
jgi:hypothetical protein